MLIRLHDKCYVNPLNVAAVSCGKLAIGVTLSNGKTHNIECRGTSCDMLYEQIVTTLAGYIDMINVAARFRASVNVDCVLSIAGINAGVAINMAGDFVIIVPCGPSSQVARLGEIVRALEPFK